MRFPPMPYMDRVIGNKSWSLIPYINQRVSERDQVVQIPYVFKAANTIRKFNDISAFNQDSTTPDQFDVDLWKGGVSDWSFNGQNASTVWENQVESMTTALSANFTNGFNLLMDYDSQSVRTYLLSQGFTDPEIDWLETINDATGHYDMYSMTQSVLEEWIFAGYDIKKWTAINGGMSMLTNGMNLIVKNAPILNSRVTDIKPGSADGSLKVVVDGMTEYDYAHVISTVPLGALQFINMTELDLNYFQKNAIRKLKYAISLIPLDIALLCP